MPQFINYDKGNRVMFHHSIVQRDNSTVEHAEMLPLAQLTPARWDDGTIRTDALIASCPIPGCGTTALVPLTGSTEEQRLHARWRAFSRNISLPAAAQSVIDDVRADGGFPVITPQTA